MIEHKARIFKEGILRFFLNVCRTNRDAYVHGMVRLDGYLKAAEKFHLFSPGYLTPEDVKVLYQDRKLPKWMKEVIMDIEDQIFGETFVDNQ